MTADHPSPWTDPGSPVRPGPLAGVRVLDYAQYVAGPFATMLLADLGADVIKVEPPGGDAWRHYQPITADGGTWFFALNRNKRSVVADLKSREGRAFSDALLASADVVVHNMPPVRAVRFGLDREAVRAVNPRAVWIGVTAFGSRGPMADVLGYDLIAQAASGLLLADARPRDPAPRRSGGIAMADLTAGLLTAIAALAGLADRQHEASGGRGLEVSLLGASLAVQVQRFVRVEPGDTETNVAGAWFAPDRARKAAGHDEDPGTDPANRSFAGPHRGAGLTPDELSRLAEHQERADELEPYYRCYQAADGFLALACLNLRQRLQVQEALGVDDPWAANPQAAPADESERAARSALKQRFASALASRTVGEWTAEFRKRGVPSGTVHEIGELHDSQQARANGLVQRVQQPGVGAVSLLGSLFTVDGEANPAAVPAPRLGADTEALLAELADTVEPSAGPIHHQ